MNPSTTLLLNTLQAYTSLWEGELAGITLPTEYSRTPPFWHTDLGVVVEVAHKGRSVWLTVMPNLHAYQCDAIAARIPATYSWDLLAAAQIFPNAMLIEEPDGRCHSCCVMIQERFTTLHTFVKHNASSTMRQHLRNALHSLATNIDLFCDNRLHHGALTAHNIGFDEQGTLRIADYPISFLRRERSDLKALLESALLIFIAACCKDCHALLTGGMLSHQPSDKLWEYVVAAGQHHGADGVVLAASTCIGQHSVDSYRTAIKKLAGEPFRPLPLLHNLLLQAAQLPVRQSLDFASDEEQNIIPDTIDFATCDFVAPPSDLYIRFHKGDSWGYANHRGEILHFGKRLTYATDFYEGVAVVGTESGYGVVNTAGKWVMRENYANIVWHGEENIITATEDGTTWHIYNRQGHQISYYGCHGFGEPREGYIVARLGSKYGYYSTSGEKVVDFIYERAGAFNKGFALVCHNGNSYHIDTTFHRIGSVQEQMLAEGKL